MKYDKKAWIEDQGERFEIAIEGKDWIAAKHVIEMLNEAGLEDDALKLANDLLLAQRDEMEKIQESQNDTI